MAISKAKKVALVDSFKDIVSSSKSLVLFSFSGISTNKLNELRDKLFSQKAGFSIMKNTLLKRVLGDNFVLSGPTAVLYSKEDPIEPIKSLYEFKKENESLDIKFGILDGSVIQKDRVDVLATLPSKNELLAEVAGGLSAPIRGLVCALGGVQRGFIGVMSQIAGSFLRG